jgi:hypothetical protein
MKITKKEFLDILEEKKACPNAVKWVKESKTETFEELWNECGQADWMLWIMAKMVGQKEWPSKKTVVLCACDCAETSLKFIPENENRPKIAIQTARDWAEGKASIEECKKAAYAVFAAASASAFDVACDAVYAVAAASAASAVSAAGHAAYAASVVEKDALKNMADIIRKRVNI